MTARLWMRWIGSLAILLGATLAVAPFLTDLNAHWAQRRLISSIAGEVEAQPQPAEPDGPSGDGADDPALVPAVSREQGVEKAFTSALLRIPGIGLRVVVVPGTTQAELAKGPGWYPESALPGEGNTGIAGHRTMYGAWFRHLDSLKEGDPIYLTFQGRILLYRVERVFPVAVNDWSVIEPCGGPALTLTTCHPVGSAAQRLVVRARMASHSLTSTTRLQREGEMNGQPATQPGGHQ